MSKKKKTIDHEAAEHAPAGGDVETDAETTASDAIADEVPVIEEEKKAETAAEEEISLSAQLAQAEARAEEYLDSWQRERATFLNYKKRVERERAEQRQQATADVLLKLLPTLDDFRRAMSAVPDAERDEWFQGVTLIQRKLERFLEDEGVTRIEALGAEFDPTFHEAVGVDDTADADSGTITEVLQEGYMCGLRVLRPALVRVAG